MEYMHGGSLLECTLEVIPSCTSNLDPRYDQPQPIEVLNGWAKQIAKGFCFIHREGMMHRDLNPSNVLLSRDLLVAKISDFGLVKRKDHTHTMA